VRKLLREPLLHFLLCGAAIFALYGRVAEPAEGRPGLVVVDERRVAALSRAVERTWSRPPDASELEGLIDEFVTEEILYREALALGLDRDDPVVRRRMRQKMEAVSDDVTDREPDEAELAAFLEANPERFFVPARVTFEQVFVAPRGGSPARERAEAVLARLRSGGRADELGDATPLPPGLSNVTTPRVAATFGEPFATALETLPQAEWAGPLASSYGLHLVQVTGREPAGQPALAEVRAEVEREWASEQRIRSRQRFHEVLRERYEVEVRLPEDESDGPGPPHSRARRP